jgi:argininosuccinate synthase
VATTSALSLYEPELASFTMGEHFEPAHSEGFVRLFGLPGAVARRVARGAGPEVDPAAAGGVERGALTGGPS